MTAYAEAMTKVKDMVAEYLDDQFHDLFVFAPISVTPRIDHDGDDYLNIFVVYEGAPEHLDVAKTLPLADHIYPRLRDMSLGHYYHVTRFVEKSEWEEANREYAALSEATPIP